MPIHWTISKPTKLVVAVCKDAVTRQDIEGYLDAIVASTPESHERAHLFAALADAERPIKIFMQLHKARQWLDAEAPAD